MILVAIALLTVSLQGLLGDNLQVALFVLYRFQYLALYLQSITFNGSSAVEDPAEIKQRLLRLQQKFGYRSEADETDIAAGFNNIQKRASTLSLVSNVKTSATNTNMVLMYTPKAGA
jgi:hypothetical protein